MEQELNKNMHFIFGENKLTVEIKVWNFEIINSDLFVI